MNSPPNNPNKKSKCLNLFAGAKRRCLSHIQKKCKNIDESVKEFVEEIEKHRAGSFIYTICVFCILLALLIIALVIAFIFSHDPNPVIVSFSSFFLAFFGLSAVVGASLHLFEVQRQNQMSNEIQKARFLLDIDNRFIQPQMLEAQKELSALWERANANINNPPLSDTEREKKSALGKEIEERRKKVIDLRDSKKDQVDLKNQEYHNALCDYLTAAIAHDLDHLRKSDPDLYHILLRNCEIFETMGLLRDRRYLNFEDVSSRFRYAIHRVYVAFCGHIDLRDLDAYSQKVFTYVIELGEWQEGEVAKGKLPSWKNPKSLAESLGLKTAANMAVTDHSH